MKSAGDGYVSIGKLIKTHGTAGDMILAPYNPSTTAPLSGLPLFIKTKDSFEGVRVERVRPSNKGYIVKFGGKDSIEEAQSLKGLEIFIRRTDIALDENEFLVSDLKGMKCVNENGRELGSVSEIYMGETDFLEIQSVKGQYLIPMTERNIISVDPVKYLILIRHEEEFKL